MLHGSLFFKKKNNLGPNISCFRQIFQNSSSCSNVAGSSVGWKAQKGDKNGKDVVFSHSLPPVTTAISVSVISPVGIAIVSTPTAIIPGFGFSLGFGLSLGFGISRSLSKVVITVSPGVGVSVISVMVSVVSKTISVSVGTVSVVSGISVVSVPGISSGISLRIGFSSSGRFSFSIRRPLASVVSVISTVWVSVISSPSASVTIVSIPSISSSVSVGFGFGLRLCHYGGNSQSYEK